MALELIETKIEYNTLELLKAMMDVSRKKIEYYDHLKNNDPLSHYTDVCMTKFSLGRRTGKTTAIKNYIQEAATLNKSILVVSFNRCMATELTQSITVDHYHFKSVDVNYSPCRGIGFIVGGYNNLEIIFDECDRDEIINFLYFNRRVLERNHSIIGLVSVGDR